MTIPRDRLEALAGEIERIRVNLAGTTFYVATKHAAELREITALLSESQPEAPSEAGDWVLVPRVPTDAMLAFCFGHDDESAARNYACMLSAAPAPPEVVGKAESHYVLIEAAENALDLIGVMFTDADGQVRASARTPIGISVKVREIYESLYAAIDAASPPPPLVDEGRDGWNFYSHLERQREWSNKTFGPSSRAKGIVAHIRKELKEIEAKPDDISEWIDVAILALDGAWRTGALPEQIIAALVAKQAKNESRVWPDWRTMPADSAIEHDRSYDSPTIKCDAWSCCGTGVVVGAYDIQATCRKCSGTGFLPNPKYRPTSPSQGGEG